MRSAFRRLTLHPLPPFDLGDCAKHVRSEEGPAPAGWFGGLLNLRGIPLIDQQKQPCTQKPTHSRHLKKFPRLPPSSWLLSSVVARSRFLLAKRAAGTWGVVYTVVWRISSWDPASFGVSLKLCKVGAHARNGKSRNPIAVLTAGAFLGSNAGSGDITTSGCLRMHAVKGFRGLRICPSPNSDGQSRPSGALTP